MSDNHYDVLGVEPGASRDELRDAYRTRVDELTAARDKKGITESQLEGNRDEVAKVRSAWNVLSDPFQRQRYDAQVDAGVDAGIDGGGDDAGDADAEPAVQLTGWRKLMAPPPPKPAASKASGNGKQPPPARPVRQPTIELPGIRIAQPKVRGMALLFDLAIVLLLLVGTQYIVPSLVQSDYKDKTSQISSLDKASSAQDDIKDARSSIDDANKAVDKAQTSGKQSDQTSAQSDLKSAQSDLKSAQKDFDDAEKDYNEKQKSQGLDDTKDLPTSTKQLDSMSSKLTDDIRGTQYITAVVTLILALLYLVPMTAMTGSTFGMRNRKIKVVRVDGSPVGWWPALLRFLIPLLIGLAIPTLGPIVALGIVLWGYRDPNGQGVHDKLARTLVVEA